MKTQDCRLGLPALIMWVVVSAGVRYQHYLVALTLTLTLSAFLCHIWWPEITPTMMVLAVCAFAASLTTISTAIVQHNDPVIRASSNHARVRVEGQVITYPKHKFGQQEFLIRTSAISQCRSADSCELLSRQPYTVAVQVPPAGDDVDRFDVVQLTGSLTAPDYAPGAQAKLTTAKLAQRVSPRGWQHYIQRVHQGLIDYLQRAHPPHNALIMGVAIGDDSYLDAQLVQGMRIFGLAHLTAVSGAHISLLLSIVIMLIGQRWSFLTGISSGVALYLLTTVVSPEPAVSRAVMMGGLYCVGLGLRYATSVFPILALTVMLVSLTDPTLATSLGFQLSVVAVSAIVLGGDYVRRQLMSIMPPWLADWLAISFLAGIATVPFIAQFQESLSMCAIIANVVVAPVIGPLTILGLLGGLIVPVVAPVGTFFFACAGLCTWWISVVVKVLPQLAFSPWITAGGNLIVLVALVAFAQKRRRFRPELQNVEY